MISSLTLRETYDNGVQRFKYCWTKTYFHHTLIKLYGVVTRVDATIEVFKECF